ncbi:MAG: plasmid pRiA4b ORF-3 family protein [Acidimicrobiia bacterium]
MTIMFEFDISLRGVVEPAWRRIRISQNASFMDLHIAIQDACGWQNYHLFRFEDNEGLAIATIPDPDWADPDPDSEEVLIRSCFPASLRCTYLYDFGDGWTHDIVFCQVVEEEGKSFRKLVAGAQPFPLEDSGGVWGWERCLRIAAHGPRDDEEREIADWLGGWSPESFNLPAARRAFDV